jgi:YHS domain-containing protein
MPTHIVAIKWKATRGFAHHVARQQEVRKIMSGFNKQRFNAAGQAFEIDPVCEMNKNKTYYFCSEICKHLFERTPEKYIKVGET